MTTIQQLNSLLRLRFFFSTEEELSRFLGYRLRGNHFNRLKEGFVPEAFFSRFAQEVREMDPLGPGLARLLEQYRATSNFYVRHVKDRRLGAGKQFLAPLLRRIFRLDAPEANDQKVRQLCDAYMEKEHDLDFGLLLLLTHSLIPTFTHKQRQDIADIDGDFRRAAEVLEELAREMVDPHRLAHILPQSIGIVQKLLTADTHERKLELSLRSRIGLIVTVEQTLRRFARTLSPRLMVEETRRLELLDVVLPEWWQAEGESADVAWRMEAMEPRGWYQISRLQLCERENCIRATYYQLGAHYVKDFDCRQFSIMRPGYVYREVLQMPQPQDAVGVDFPELTFGNDNREVRVIRFEVDSPTGSPMTLRKMDVAQALAWARKLKTYADRVIDTHEDVAVEVAQLEVAVTREAIFLQIDDSTLQIDRHDAEGRETIPGISALTHADHYVLLSLQVPSPNAHSQLQEKLFIGLDSIGCYLDSDQLDSLPFVHLLPYPIWSKE